VLIRPRGRIFVATEPTDLRKSYDGLAALVAGKFGRDVFEGDLFVFRNRRGNQVRVLYWDRDGYAIWMKRLEAGTFRRVRGDHGEEVVEVDVATVTMLLEGVDAKVVTRRKRYERPTKSVASATSSCLHDRS
jgi:transposase